jgi:hypothetical protein
MGIAFLPWELFPAYILGPLLCLLGVLLLIKSDNLALWSAIAAILNVCFGAWIVWRRYATGVEPLWTEERRLKAAIRKSRDVS